MKPLFTFILLTLSSFSIIHAQEIGKEQLNKKQTAQQDLINKTALKKQVAIKQQLKASTTSQEIHNSNKDHNAAIELKINYLRQKECCEEEIVKLKNQLK